MDHQTHEILMFFYQKWFDLVSIRKECKAKTPDPFLVNFASISIDFFIKMIILFFGKKLHILRFFVVFIVFKNSVPTKQTRVRHNFVVFVKFPDKCTFSDCVRVTKLCVFSKILIKLKFYVFPKLFCNCFSRNTQSMVFQTFQNEIYTQ